MEISIKYIRSNGLPVKEALSFAQRRVTWAFSSPKIPTKIDRLAN